MTAVSSGRMGPQPKRVAKSEDIRRETSCMFMFRQHSQFKTTKTASADRISGLSWTFLPVLPDVAEHVTGVQTISRRALATALHSSPRGPRRA